MCDSVCHVLRHVFARKSHLTTGVVEWAVDFREGTFVFHVVIHILSFKGSVSTFVRAGNRILDTLRIVIFCNIFKSGFIFVAVFTGVRSLGTHPLLVGSDVATLEPLPTPMLTLYLHKLTPSQLVLRRWIFIQVLFVFSKFPRPFTAVLLV
ncbi:hypothetical protein GBAR_LOCUS10044 [Geodia barretti]|uniref:Uncharacterized protein n=1 Tax=Geodia barretti TaxID=519541 RepID=A0AA35RS94_GEOBA|nr:hypothetical protein GBAR_LOCUS10044 [Geodia barretti]